MISDALGLGYQSEQLGQRKIDSLVNNIYKLGILEAQQPRSESPFVQNVPGYGNLTLSQYKALPTEDRQYITHVLSARQRGEQPLSREEFDAIGDKDRHPATAEAAAIDQLYNEYNGAPPQSEIKRIHDLYNPVKEPLPKTPSPVTWTTATNELTKRFGKLDPTGMWAVTPELQATHRKSQEVLTDLKDQGLDPLRAVNEAENKARNWKTQIEDRYFQYIDAAGKDDRKVEAIKSDFYRKFGYLPTKGIY